MTLTKDGAQDLRELLRWHKTCGWVQAVLLTQSRLGLVPIGTSYEDYAWRCPWVLEWKSVTSSVPNQPETGWNLFRIDLNGMLEALAAKHGCAPVDLLLQIEET